MLKHSDEKAKTEFALLVINFINPKYNNPQVEIKPDIEKCKSFASKCPLTKDEFMIALNMASRRLLTYKDGKREFSNPNYDGETVEYFREIDLSTLGKIETAYIQFKQNDIQYGIGRKRLSEFLNPEHKISPEEAKAVRKRNKETFLKAIEENKPCGHAFLFYEYVIAKGGLKSFLANTEAKKILILNKMKDIVEIEKQKKKSVHFGAFELSHLSNYFKNNNNEIIIEVNMAFGKLQAMAITQVKNDLTYNWFKKQIIKKIKMKILDLKKDQEVIINAKKYLYKGVEKRRLKGFGKVEKVVFEEVETKEEKLFDVTVLGKQVKEKDGVIEFK